MFRTVFKKCHTFMPVIHVLDEKQAVEQSSVAFDNGADGIFLIGHGVHCDDLLLIHQKVKEHMPNRWIGINCLDLDPANVFEHLTSLVDGVWIDNAQVQEKETDQPEAKAILNAKNRANYRGLYFGGVAFKYQRHVTDLARGAYLAKDFVDVVTTSGMGTGRAPNTSKIKTMKEAIGEHPLAIASGITVANVNEYLDADVFMVATGISKSFHTLNPKLVKELADKMEQ